MQPAPGRPRVIAHVDMDAFYVSAERLDRPEWRQRPLIVGHDGPRSVVLSASYDLRALGVHSSQPVAQAKRLAPHAIVAEPRHARYQELSAGIMATLRQLSPAVEQVSVDEAYLDLSGALRGRGTPEELAARMRAGIREAVGLPASVGLAPNKFLAKMASGRAKPDGIFSIPPARVHEFLDPLPIGELFGVGEATARSLRLAGYSTAGQLAAARPEEVSKLLGQGAMKLALLARGIDDRPIVTEREEKSLGAEHTFGTDITDPATLERTLLWLAHRVAERARAADRLGEVVALKIRWEDFTTHSRQRRLERPSDAAAELAAAAVSLMRALPQPLPPVRLIGLRLDSLTPAGTGLQLSLDSTQDARRDAEETMDRINARFAGAVGPASLLGAGSPRRRIERGDEAGVAEGPAGNSPGAQGSG
ncbi:DNA polymerase IV [Galactobacter valiniphilus]|uniref:DNA polymerase IV n=1 Tax=Galactobacter valiniphilus TaxID=2676122 RepID=UPI0037368D28